MQNEILFEGIDQKSGKSCLYYIQQNDPFYPVGSLFHNCRKSADFLSRLTVEDIQETQNAMNEIFATPSRMKTLNHKLDLKKFSTYFHCLYEIHTKINKKNFAHEIELLELLLHSGTICKKKLNLKYSTAHTILDSFISTILANLIILTYSTGYIQTSEMYCRKQLAWLNKIKNLNPPDMAKREFMCKLTLAQIYFDLGYPETMLSLIKEAYKIAQKFYYDEFDYFVSDLSQLCRKAAEFYYLKEPHLSLKAAQKFLMLYETVLKKSNFQFEAPQLLKKNDQYLQIVFNTITKKHQKEIVMMLENSDIIQNFINIEYFPKLALIVVSPSDICCFPEFKKYFHQYNVKFISKKNTLEINSANCSPQLLEEICHQYCEFHIQQNKMKKIETKKSNEKNESQITLPTPTYESYADSGFTLFSSSIEEGKTKLAEEKILSPSKIAPKLQVQGIKAEQNSEIKDSKNDILIQPLVVKFHWANSNLNYCSLEKNTGTVKKLSCDFLPDYVWFGYIPEWILIDTHYNPEFKNRLTRGLIRSDCIRDITKELKTIDKNALKFENSYKFKIVIPSQDYRLYGWIEEEYKEKSGKTHYLICFGLLENHKKLKLLDPNIIKQHHYKSTEKSELKLT